MNKKQKDIKPFKKIFENFLIERECDGINIEYECPSNYLDRFTFWLEYNLNKIQVKSANFNLNNGKLNISNLSFFDKNDPCPIFPFSVTFEKGINHPDKIKEIQLKS